MTDNKNKESKDQGYDYIIRAIQFLDKSFGISFFISSKDFDVLYRWYEKRIPRAILEESITNVVERRRKKNMRVKSFSNFYYEVKKNFEAFLQMNVGAPADENDASRTAAETTAGGDKTNTEYAEIETFFSDYPEALAPMKTAFEEIFKKLKAGEPPALTALHETLTELFNDDETLAMKTAIFTRSLAPELRRPEIENRYRLNYLLNKYKIPDFELFIKE